MSPKIGRNRFLQEQPPPFFIPTTTTSEETLKQQEPMTKKRKDGRSFIPTLTNQQHTQSRQSEVPTLSYRKGKKEMESLFHNIKPKLFSPKNIPENFEQLLKKLKLLEFTRIECDSVFRFELLVELVSNYNPEKKNSFVSGSSIDVSKKHLAKALKLPLAKKPEISFIEVYSDERWAFGENGCSSVEKELTQGEKLVDCYYASHLQCLIKSQYPYLFEETQEEEAKDDKDESEEREKKLKRIIESKDQELETKRAEILRLEGALQSSRTKFANYRERYPVQEKPLYQDAGPGGLVLSTREIEAQKQKQEDMTKEVPAQLKETRKLHKSPDKNEHDVFAEIEENQKSLDGNDADEAK
ncbi:hypothetical protein Tco_1260451, partial [Tanacetum coccineum]